ncbi:MAG: hypothetical protein WD070_04390 [Pirellulaceae bacterium]
MHPLTTDVLIEQLALADALLVGRETMLTPQDLPGRYGRVVRAIDRVLQATACESVVGGGWAVWRHGFINRVTQDIDILLPADRIDEFVQVAAVSGFQLLTRLPGRWPKLLHKETDVQVDILPEGERPGSPPQLAPTTIPSPRHLGAAPGSLTYVGINTLVELKLAAARLKDKADIVEILRANPGEINKIRTHLAGVHSQYVDLYDSLVEESRQDDAER